MDADLAQSHDSWLMRLGEHTVRSFAVALVLTGQMLPAGAVSAEEEPPVPSFVAPPPPQTAERLPEPVKTEPLAQAPAVNEAPPADEKLPVQEKAEEKTEEALSTQEKEEIPAAESSVNETPLNPEFNPEAATEAPAPIPTEGSETETNNPTTTLQVIQPLENSPVALQEGETYTFGEWTMIIRPGFVAPKPAPFIQAPISEVLVPQTNVSVPVSININNVDSQWPLWETPWAYSGYWNNPTSAYLFDRPRPYWQLRSDFHYLRPFIPGLRY